LRDCCVSVLSRLTRKGRLRNLRTFKIQGYVGRTDRRGALHMMVTYLPPLFFQFRQLEELELGCRQVLPMVLDGICYNGGTLKKLNLSELNPELSGLLTVGQMQQLRDHCCRLVELTGYLSQRPPGEFSSSLEFHFQQLTVTRPTIDFVSCPNSSTYASWSYERI
jgi:hypothetical protein